MTREIWAVAHQAHPTTYRDTKHEALALVDAWTTEQAAAICWPMTMSHRILVTGSRDWTDVATVEQALADAWADLGNRRDTVLVQGECHLGGADQIAADVWRSWDLVVEGHPAEMGPTGHVLGPKRNAHMVSLGADVCLAFPLPSSRGTRNCMRLAREAGIPVRTYAPKETP